MTGGIVEQSGDLQYRSFKLTALFAIAPERIPVSPSHTWISTPPIEIFGDFFVDALDNWGHGDQWVKCWMHRDQELYQIGFGAVQIPVGQAHDVETLVFEENHETRYHVYMKGSQLMPSVWLKGVNTATTLWSRLEVLFDFQTEGQGSAITIWHGGLNIRTFQWPLIAVP